jgi:hypothetical protein
MMAQCLQWRQIVFTIHRGNHDATEPVRAQHAIHYESCRAAIAVYERMDSVTTNMAVIARANG